MVRRSSADRISRLPIERSGSATAALSKRSRPPRQRLHPGPLEKVRPIVQPQLEPLARDGRKIERIVRPVVTLDLAQPQLAGSRFQHAALDRIVLEHHQRVEQLPDPGHTLDLRKPDMLVRHQP